ncbi:trichohyalin-like isoform X2 [Colossoma macropomum]|uniref:trichohyalin-like isoform X2 n=1 Tax=Colossoma macropomum TaxID=42526 RepID=UPI0018645220|nr:trichohyalin-like isoform X2 [Colossoma macropomum]
MKRSRKHQNTKQSTAPQEMKQERELSPPPSPPAPGCTCIPKMSLFRKRGRKQERQKEEEQLKQLQAERRETELTKKETTQKRKKERQRKNMEQENDKEIRDLEEAVRLLEEEIQGFRERKKELKRELKTLKKKIAGVEMETSKTRQTKKEWKREMEAMKERIVQEEKQREEERTGQREVICKEIVITVVKADREMEEKKEKRDDRKMATVSEKQEVIKERKSEEELLEEMEKQREEEQLKERRESQEAVENGKEVTIEMENLQMEPAAPSTSRKYVVQRVLSSVLSSIHSGVQSIMEFRKKFSVQAVQDKEEEPKDKSPRRPLVALGAPTGVLTIRIRGCRDFKKNTQIQKDTQCMVRITVGRIVKCSRPQPFKDNLTFNEVKHFSIQIQKEEALGVQESSSVKVDLISFDGDSAVPKLMGSTTIKLQEVLYKSSVSQQIDLRLGGKKVCKLDADLTFTYGSFGYGYSHQMKHPGRTMEKLVEESLFLRCPPPEDRRDPHYNVTTPCGPSSVNIMSSLMQRDAQRDTECRISAGIMNCMERRGRSVSSFIKA